MPHNRDNLLLKSDRPLYTAIHFTEYIFREIIKLEATFLTIQTLKKADFDRIA